MNKYQPELLERTRKPEYDDEVDLLELFAIIWEGKWLVAMVAAAIGAVTLTALLLLPSQYRVETVLDRTSEYNVRVMEPSKLERIQESGQRQVPYQVAAPAVDTIYSTGLALADSIFVKKAFWESKTGRVINLFESEAAITEDDRRFQEFASRLEVSRPDSKDSNNTLSRIGLQTAAPGEGIQLLSDYIDFIDRYTINQFVNQLRTGYESSLAKLEADYDSRFNLEKTALNDEIIRLEEAYGQAKALGISETPYQQVQNVEIPLLDTRLYLLGTAVLGEEISALRARQDGSLEAFVPELRAMEQWREQITRDLEKLETAAGKARAFVIVSPPEASMEPVAPNRLLIFIASLMGGLLLGVLLVFIRHGVRTYKARETD